MAAPKTQFVCANCATTSPKWVGRCPGCGQWNTMSEETVAREKPRGIGSPVRTGGRRIAKAEPRRLQEIRPGEKPLIVTPDAELNRVLGGGIMPGSMVLVGGEPGIGKSTLLLQMALQNAFPVVYVSGEESDDQLKLRADRVGGKNSEVHVLTETCVEEVVASLDQVRPRAVVVDSIQTLYSENIDSTPGSITQIRECTEQLLRYAKQTGTAVFVIGHITKDGHIAGPKLLEHMVDTVLQFEGDRHQAYRILRTLKNRFGSTAELGIYEMQGSGLREVSNPSEILMSQRDVMLSGISISATVEGVRPLLVETQALVSTAVYGTPQRTTTGFDNRRLNMLLAVLEKRCGFRLGNQDVFVNIAGGIRIDDPGIDLGVVAAILSSYNNIALPPNIAFAGEVGLSGEVRAVGRIEPRIREAEKLGFTEIVVSQYNKGLSQLKKGSIKIKTIATITDLNEWLFG